MSEEEAVEICKKIIKQNNEIVKQTRKNKDINAMQLTANCDNESIAIETLLQSREKDKAETERLRYIKKNFDYVVQKETEKKDKIINEMALYFNTGLSMCEDCEKCFESEDIYKCCKDCIKQYFEKKVEE